MALQVPRSDIKSSQLASGVNSRGEFQSYKPKWIFTFEEIEEHSPSRKDGISHEQESHLRQLCCSYLQDLGMELKVAQVTIATTMVLCHRFYMHQSHAKNHWQTIANASMFLACKADDTPRWLRDLVVVAYKLMYRWDPSAPQRIRQKEVYDKQKNLILVGERLILAAVAFDLNIQLPYKPLVAALNSMQISQKELGKVAWNFVNDWLRTTLCLQYKPHYIAAGSIFLAAKLQKIKLPSSNGKVWWMQFDVSPKQLEEVIQHMLQLLGQSSKQAQPFPCNPENKIEPICRKRKSESTESCISNESAVQDSGNFMKATVLATSVVVKSNIKHQDVHANDTVNRTEDCKMNDSGSTNSVVEDGDGGLITEDACQKSGCKIVSVKGSSQKIDIAGLRHRIKGRKSDRMETKKSGNHLNEDINNEAWIERELENGIVSVYAS